MQLKHYGLYDGVTKEYVRTFTSKNDEEAHRACKYIVNEKNFDDIAGKDMQVCFLFTLDTETGMITDNGVHPVCSLSTFIEERKQMALEYATKQKLFNDDFVKELQASIVSEVKSHGANARS